VSPLLITSAALRRIDPVLDAVRSSSIHQLMIELEVETYAYGLNDRRLRIMSKPGLWLPSRRYCSTSSMNCSSSSEIPRYSRLILHHCEHGSQVPRHEAIIPFALHPCRRFRCVEQLQTESFNCLPNALPAPTVGNVVTDSCKVSAGVGVIRNRTLLPVSSR
jgi:hypothetical protein